MKKLVPLCPLNLIVVINFKTRLDQTCLVKTIQVNIDEGKMCISFSLNLKVYKSLKLNYRNRSSSNRRLSSSKRNNSDSDTDNKRLDGDIIAMSRRNSNASRSSKRRHHRSGSRGSNKVIHSEGNHSSKVSRSRKRFVLILNL